MATTVIGAFNDFLDILKPTATEEAYAQINKTSILDCLKSNFGVDNFFQSGSFGNSTNISKYSDIDYFAVINDNYVHDNSSTFLQNVKTPLSNRFPKTAIRISNPAIRLDFSYSLVEVVPAKKMGDFKYCNNPYEYYGIANGDGGWMKTSPKAHNKYVLDVDFNLKHKVRPLIRFIKAWNYYQNVGIQSFYLELRVAKYASDTTSILYSYDIRSVIKHLIACDLAAITDPVGVSGYVKPCLDSQNDEIISKLNTALTRADNAINAEKSNKMEEAFGWWQKFFGKNFPSYG